MRWENGSSYLFGRADGPDPQHGSRSCCCAVYLARGPRGVQSAPRRALQIARVILSTLEVVMFFWAVSYLPLADTVTFYLASPIYVTALSAVFLGERVGWRRWSAVLFGFAGVVIALRPWAAMLTCRALIALAGSSSSRC